MKIALGSDHAGFALKEVIARFLTDEQIPFKDFGVNSADRADYPDTGIPVAEAVASGEFDRGILVCGTGIGMSMLANKVPGIRAALCINVECALMSRSHNNSNILVLGGRIIDSETAIEITKAWLSEEFSEDENHVRRLQKIMQLEKKYGKAGG
jgi:ribose 5-phosphate isomerase B